MKVYIFDMDGTFINSMEYWNNLMANFLDSQGIKANKDLGIELINMTLKDGISYTKKKFSLVESEEEIFLKIKDLIAYNYKNSFDIDSEIINIFEKIKARGDKIVLATATQRNLVNIVLRRFSLEQYFDLQCVSDEVEFHKNNPKYFENIADYFSVANENCIVVEDALYSIKTANSIGMKTIGVLFQAPASHVEDIKSLADITCQKLGDIKNYF